MNMSETEIQKLLEKIDDYNETITAIICISHVLRWDNQGSFRSNTYFFIARRMDTSENNRINPEAVVTPDLIIQIDENYGIICELKRSFPRNRDYWENDFNQLLKYDDDLKGWRTDNEYIEISDLVLLTHNRMKVYVSDYLENRINIKQDLFFNKNFAVIAYYRVDQQKSWMYLEKSYGALTNQDLDERFRVLLPVPLEKVLPLNPIKFYDEKPELPYIMNILWVHILNQYPQREEFMEAEGGKKIITINVNIDELTERLNRQYSPFINENNHRQQKIPKISWVREAMEMFVRLKYAYKERSSDDNYIVKYKKILNPLETFTKEVVQGETRTMDNFI